MLQKSSRRWVFTINNPSSVCAQVLSDLPCVYMIYGDEVAPTTGTQHYQGYVVFDRPHRLSALKKVFPPGTHLEPAIGTTAQCVTYCSKEGWPTEHGVRPMDRKEVGADYSQKYADAIASAKAGCLDEVAPGLYLKFYSTLRRIQKDHMIKPESLSGTCGLWIYGPSGSGKTHSVVNAYPDRYITPLNKWWDGYQQEEVVHLDEVAPTHTQWIAPYLKKWADKWPFDAEVKGGAMQLRPQKLIVTSNYSIDQMGFAPEDLDAIKRRYVEVHKVDREQTILLL